MTLLLTASSSKINWATQNHSGISSSILFFLSVSFLISMSYGVVIRRTDSWCVITIERTVPGEHFLVKPLAHGLCEKVTPPVQVEYQTLSTCVPTSDLRIEIVVDQVTSAAGCQLPVDDAGLWFLAPRPHRCCRLFAACASVQLLSSRPLGCVTPSRLRVQAHIERSSLTTRPSGRSSSS